ncbi:hypothetical protein PPACK8108_LOCUS23869 [Phakopsora pachyrhizi]|uniref:Uncharacterized protein n=1 Tax=Phakopsora pachyrhizi TaxID=170000 RepID=A0AAV0BRY1_PHAPC|nr:hypothetical protein PPACK8108_LOCUS23869 [Phakopsora pachyrhizi]
MSLPMNRLIRAYERSFKSNPSLTLAITNGCLKCFGDFLAQLLPAMVDVTFSLDVHRSLRFLIFGLLHGPCVGKWHEFLENRVPLTNSQRISQSDLDTDLQSIAAEKSLPSSPHNLNRPNYSIRSRSQNNIEPSSPRHYPVSAESKVIGFLSSSKRSRSTRLGGLLKRVLLDQLIMSPIFVFVFIFTTALLEGLSFEDIKDRLDHLYWHILMANWKIWPLIQFINFNFMPLQPWQSSCGILWTVFLSLSTHSASVPKPSSSNLSLLKSTVVGLSKKIIDSTYNKNSSTINTTGAPNVSSIANASVTSEN